MGHHIFTLVKVWARLALAAETAAVSVAGRAYILQGSDTVAATTADGDWPLFDFVFVAYTVIGENRHTTQPCRHCTRIVKPIHLCRAAGIAREQLARTIAAAVVVFRRRETVLDGTRLVTVARGGCSCCLGPLIGQSAIVVVVAGLVIIKPTAVVAPRRCRPVA